VSKIKNPEYCIAFGENLRKLRKKKGLTMMDLAFEADIEYSQIARIERGIANPTISTLYVLAKSLDVKPQDLLKFEFNS